MRDDIFEEDLWEEDMFEDESQPSEDVDDDTQYVLELMQQGMDLCEEGLHYVNKLKEVCDVFGADITGADNEVFIGLKTIFEKIIPSLITGDEEALIKNVMHVLNASEDVAKAFFDDKRTKVLERLDENNNK